MSAVLTSLLGGREWPAVRKQCLVIGSGVRPAVHFTVAAILNGAKCGLCQHPEPVANPGFNCLQEEQKLSPATLSNHVSSLLYPLKCKH